MNTSESIAKIAAALVAAKGQFATVAKSGKNKFDNYTYANLEDYVHAVRPVLVANGLSVLTSVDEIIPMEDRTTQKGGKEHCARVRCTMRIIHTSGEWIEASTWGEGQDRADKAVYKAITGARKYGLASALCLATSDDPEADEGMGNTPPAAQPKAPPAKPTAAPKPAPLSPEDKAWLDTYSETMVKRGCAKAKAQSILRTMLDKKGTKLADLTTEQRDVIMGGVREGKWDQYFPPENKAA